MVRRPRNVFTFSHTLFLDTLPDYYPDLIYIQVRLSVSTHRRRLLLSIIQGFVCPSGIAETTTGIIGNGRELSPEPANLGT